MKGEALRTVRDIVRRARGEGRDALLEPEGLRVLKVMGIAVPRHVMVRGSKEAAGLRLSRMGSDQAVVKVVSPDILHKSDVRGVEVVPNKRAAVLRAVRAMEKRFRNKNVAGYTVNQFIDYDRAIGHELLLGMRWTQDYGPVVTFGSGGIHTEFLARNFKEGVNVAIFPAGASDREIGAALRRTAVAVLISGGLRGQKARVDMEKLADTASRFAWFARELMPEVTELEVNPLVISGGRLVAVDALVKLGRLPAAAAPPRPVRKIKNLLEARSAAVIGVSEKMNTGRVILRNMLKEGFDRERLFVVKTGADSIDGCRCFPDAASLPERVDLAVLTIPAAGVSDAAAELIEHEKTESMIIIPGGLEEKAGTKGIVSRMHESLRRARESAWEGPVINGGNCLGIRSVPGDYDTMFIPDYKKSAPPSKDCRGLAIVSQSGAFAISKMDKLAGIAPKYSISIGNQTDLTIGDYMAYLADDPELKVFAVYVEGFKPLDGLRFLEAVRKIASGGRTVVFYRAGRTSEGRKATASHTASIAEDYPVTRELAAQAGAVVAHSITDFEDLTRLFMLLEDKEVRGSRLGAVSNAGFECVAMADNLGGFQLPEFTRRTRGRLEEVFRSTRIDAIVDVHNPIDLTPMAGDAPYEETVRAVMEDGNVDAGVVGCVPMTPALNTLEAGDGHKEDLRRADSAASRLIRLKDALSKPWVAVVDAGRAYDPMARYLEEGGVPTFRTQDRALRLFNVFCRERLKARKG